MPFIIVENPKIKTQYKYKVMKLINGRLFSNKYLDRETAEKQRRALYYFTEDHKNREYI